MRYISRLLFLLLLLSAGVRATVLSGTFKYPNGGLVSGILTVQLTKPGIRNICASSVVVPTTPVRITITGGAIQGSNDIVPTDCLSTFQPYLVQLRDGSNALIISQWWYVGLQGGAYGTPASGSLYIAPTGLGGSSVSGAPGIQAWQIAETQVGFRTGSSAIAFAGTGDVSTTVSWSKTFSDVSYVAVCTYRDATSPASVPVYVKSITSITTLTVSVTAHKNTAGSTNGVVVCHGREP